MSHAEVGNAIWNLIQNAPARLFPGNWKRESNTAYLVLPGLKVYVGVQGYGHGSALHVMVIRTGVPLGRGDASPQAFSRRIPCGDLGNMSYVGTWVHKNLLDMYKWLLEREGIEITE